MAGLDKIKHDEAAYTFGDLMPRSRRAVRYFDPTHCVFRHSTGPDQVENEGRGIGSDQEKRIRDTLELWNTKMPKSTKEDEGRERGGVFMVNGRPAGAAAKFLEKKAAAYAGMTPVNPAT